MMSASTSFGAGKFTAQTDGSGNFIASPLGTASWTGGGTVGANITGGLSSEPNPNNQIIVTNATSGTFSVGNFAILAGDPATYINGNRANTGVGLSINVVATGTGATFDFGGIGLNTADVNGWTNFQVSNMQNVESLTVTYSFSQPLAAIRGGTNTTAPMLVGMRRAAGNNIFDATATFANLQVDDVAYNILNHLAADFIELGPNNGPGPGVGNAAVWNNTTGIGTVTNNNTDGFHGIGRLDIDGGGVIAPTQASATDMVVDEIERTYATGMTWTMTRDGGGAFSNGTAFYFSFNGVQYISTIPEPSAVILSILGLSFVIGRRKRS